MAVFYFTYGTEGHPFRGGWSEVEASSFRQAEETFRKAHPSKDGLFLNCAGTYTAQRFMETRMYKEGNFGKRCHERLVAE